MEQHPHRPRAAVPYLKLPEDGDPYLEGSRCLHCGAVYADSRRVCARCFARDQMATVRLADHGRLYIYTIVHRSFPGVQTPFVAAVVDLDGGGTLHGTLTDVDPDPAHLPFDMPVRVVFRDSGQRDADGAPFIVPMFVPATARKGDHA